ncbi:MAG: hypothetical protein R3C56_29915 [Pirellulaceae bacterium]
MKAKRNVRQFGRNLSPPEITNRGCTGGIEDSDRGKSDFFHRPSPFPAADSKRRLRVTYRPTSARGNGRCHVYLAPEGKGVAGRRQFLQLLSKPVCDSGTAYRDVLNWSESVGKMAVLKPHVVVPGHTLPIQGEEAATTALKD